MITLISQGTAFQLSLHPYGDVGVIVRVNGHDYPVLIEAQDRKLYLFAWEQSGVDEPTVKLELTGYE
jgi:hypothetical protein